MTKNLNDYAFEVVEDIENVVKGRSKIQQQLIDFHDQVKNDIKFLDLILGK